MNLRRTFLQRIQSGIGLCLGLLLSTGAFSQASPLQPTPPDWSQASTPTLEDLIELGVLRIGAEIETRAPLYQRTPLTLAVKIATQDGFSRGTRVREFRVKDAVVRAYSSFADNQTLREAGYSWTQQSWRFRLYPHNPGLLALPPLRVFVSINTAEDGVVEGELTVRASPISIQSPPDAPDKQNWLAASSLQVRESWSEPQISYHPGDAITRTRHFELGNTPGMMLATTVPDDIPGASLYRAPAQVEDRSNRGQLVGIRDERLVVSFEEPGSYWIPGLDLRWFNTTTGRFEKLSLDGREFMVTALTSKDDSGFSLNDITSPGLRGPLLVTVLVLAFLATAFWLLHDRPEYRVLQQRLNNTIGDWRRYRRYRKALSDDDSSLAIDILQQSLQGEQRYSRLQQAVRGHADHEQSLRQLLDHAYGSAHDTLPTPQALCLWRHITREKSAVKANHAPVPRLNPLPTPSTL